MFAKLHGFDPGLTTLVFLLGSCLNSASADAAGADCASIGGLICTDTTWTTDGSPYCVTSSIIVGCGKTLTVEPGVQVRFPAGQLFGLAVGSGSFGPGTLIARGTIEAPIVFTSDAPDAEPGDWVGLNFTSQAADAEFDKDGNYTGGSVLESVVVEYAGGGGPGAAVIINDSSPYFSRCTVCRNASRGFFVVGVGDQEAPLRIENCLISGNIAGSGIFGGTVGGGIYFALSPSAALTGNTISSNSAGRGGGVYFHSSPFAMLSRNMINGNTASSGGGIFCLNTSSATLTGNTVSDNKSADAGGGIYLERSPSARLSANTINGNTVDGDDATDAGGGICVYSSESASLTGNTIRNNGAYSGGGIYFALSPSAALTGNTISNNTAQSGGAVYVLTSNSATLTDNTFVRNFAGGQGGAMFVVASLDVWVTDSVLAGNISSFVTGGAGGIKVEASPRFSLTAEKAGSVSLLDNRPFDLSIRNAFGSPGGDIDARNVWWGTTNADEIERRIWDCFDNFANACVLTTPWRTTGLFDFTGDGEILGDDWAGFAECLHGPEQDPGMMCRSKGDIDRSGSIDLFDFSVLQTVPRPSPL